MLGPGGLSFGWIMVASARPLPGALPEGAPLDNVGTQGDRVTPVTLLPTLSKTAPRRCQENGTPAGSDVVGVPFASTA
jgi:hypothetical protein